MKSTNGSRALVIGTSIAAMLAAGITLGMCPKLSEVQTTVEAKYEHGQIEKRIAAAAEVQHDRLDAVDAGHRQLIDQQRAELKEYRKELREDRATQRIAQRELLDAINRRR